MTEPQCDCDPGDAYGHHVWCNIYRPAGMSDDEWESAVQAHPLLLIPSMSECPVGDGIRGRSK